MSCSMPTSSAGDLAGRARLHPEQRLEDMIEEQHRVAPSGRYGRLAWRKWTAGAVRPGADLRATCSTSSSRCSSDRSNGMLMRRLRSCLRMASAATDPAVPARAASKAR
jgi:hypothetical protein